MNNLLNFLIKHVSWFVFMFYVITSCVLLFRNNPYFGRLTFTITDNHYAAAQ